MQPHDRSPTEPQRRLESVFTRIVTPFEEFIHRQTTSGLLLMLCALIALFLANSPLAGAYHHFLETQFGVRFGGFALEKSVHHWVNDGLMTLFFFLVGLEIKREILVGELSDPRQAALPIIAAVGGMLVPALVYVAINGAGDTARGWGIPMATDIAFAVGALVLLGTRVPRTLIMFLVALAIVDDLGAVIVIALFYTENVSVGLLGVAAGLLAVLILFNAAGIRSPLPYFIVGSLVWLAMLKSGIHATLAGVLTALTIPARSKYDPAGFSGQVRELMNRYDSFHRPGTSIMTNDDLRSVLQTLENGVHMVETPLQRLEHSLHLPVALLIIPIFALANAGIPLELDALGASLTHPVTLGVAVGLIAGKVIGVAGFAYLGLKMGIGRLPQGTRFAHIIGVGLLAGIGFTMSIFISELAFVGQPQYLIMAKTGILAASIVAGVLGFVWLRMVSNRDPEAQKHSTPSPAPL